MKLAGGQAGQLQHCLVVEALRHLRAHEVGDLEVALLPVDQVFPEGLLVEFVAQDVREALLDALADGRLGPEGVGELEREDGLALGAEGTQAVNDVVEGVVEAVVEGEEGGQVLAVPQHLRLKLVDLLEAEEGDLYLALPFYLVAHLLRVLVGRTAHVAQDLDWLALVVVGDLREEVLSVVGEEVV